MRKRLSRLAPIIILGVTAWLLAACDDAEVVAEPVTVTPTSAVVEVTVTPTAPTTRSRQRPSPV